MGGSRTPLLRSQAAGEYPAEDSIVHARHYGTTMQEPVGGGFARLTRVNVRNRPAPTPALAPVPAAVTFGYVCYYLIGLKAFRVRKTSGG
jgi:hypothetical protein